MIFGIRDTSIGMKNGENHMLISGGNTRCTMRHYFNRSRKRKVTYLKNPIQHSPSLIGNAPANGIALLHVFAQAPGLAGGSMSADRTDENRLTEVGNGRKLGRVTIDVGIIPATGQQGFYEYAVVKYERSTSVPVVGTDPVPSSADCVGTGLQQAVRRLTPGYCIQFGLIPITTETTVVRKITISFAKFRKAKVRDGDYYCIIFYNRTQATGTYDLHFRYRTGN